MVWPATRTRRLFWVVVDGRRAGPRRCEWPHEL